MRYALLLVFLLSGCGDHKHCAWCGEKFYEEGTQLFDVWLDDTCWSKLYLSDVTEHHGKVTRETMERIHAEIERHGK